MLSVVPGEELRPLSAQGATPYITASAKQTPNAVFHFSPLFVKVKILFGFLLGNENSY